MYWSTKDAFVFGTFVQFLCWCYNVCATNIIFEICPQLQKSLWCVFATWFRCRYWHWCYV